jgi:Rieske Fe-S protein
MATSSNDPRAAIDVRVDTPGREGLAGTAPASVYAPPPERDQITIPPDFTAPEAQPLWRQDFPIDWPQDQYVERRDFMKFMVLTSGAFAVGQLWIALQSWWRHRRDPLPGRRIAAVDDIGVGQSLMFNYPGEEDACLLVRVSAAEFVAFSQKCTHLSCAVIPRPDQGVFYCPCHEGRFDLRSGAAIAGPPRRPLPRVVLDVRGGEIFATGVEERTV